MELKEMTLRDYFAAKAMQGMLISYGKELVKSKDDANIVSTKAFNIANAMVEKSRGKYYGAPKSEIPTLKDTVIK